MRCGNATSAIARDSVPGTARNGNRHPIPDQAQQDHESMTTLDLDFVRSQFPAFAEPSLAGFAHFENAGG